MFYRKPNFENIERTVYFLNYLCFVPRHSDNTLLTKLLFGHFEHTNNLFFLLENVFILIEFSYCIRCILVLFISPSLPLAPQPCQHISHSPPKFSEI